MKVSGAVAMADDPEAFGLKEEHLSGREEVTDYGTFGTVRTIYSKSGMPIMFEHIAPADYVRFDAQEEKPHFNPAGVNAIGMKHEDHKWLIDKLRGKLAP